MVQLLPLSVEYCHVPPFSSEPTFTVPVVEFRSELLLPVSLLNDTVGVATLVSIVTLSGELAFSNDRGFHTLQTKPASMLLRNA